ncbi:MAG: cardiolipin synthase [Arsenophonus sp.]|nr:MAG: cardiolipin synthase [Arsenophonus sp.]
MYLNWIEFFIYFLIIFIIIIHIFLERRSVSNILMWIFFIYIFPIVGVIIYSFFNEFYFFKNKNIKVKRKKFLVRFYSKKLNKFIYNHQTNNSVFNFLFNLCKKEQGTLGIKGNKITLLSNYKTSLSNIIRDIDAASHSIEMVFYIWHVGGLVNKVSEALINASIRGVRCKVLIDSFGSWMFFYTSLFKKMRKSGITIIKCLKINFFYFLFHRIDFRQHKKMIIIDHNISYVGSMNMVDPYFFKKKKNIGPWIDILIRIQGPFSSVLSVMYAFDWEMETGEKLYTSLLNKKYFFKKKNTNNMIQLVTSGPGYSKKLIQQVLVTAIFSAKRKLILTTPYFVPTNYLVYALCAAAMRGVEVLIILPKKTNSFLVNWASRSFYTELLEAGVKIYQFKNGMLHTKSILVDNQLSLVGSFNLDIRSFWLNFEITVIIEDEIFGKHLNIVQYDYLSNSTPILKNQWKKRPAWNYILEQICYFFSPFL